MEIFVARQPIFNKNKEIIAYELLYRDSSKNFFNNNINASKATSILLVNSYFSMGIEHLVGNHQAFINFDKKLIDHNIPMLFNKDKIVIEIIEDVVPDKEFMDNLKKLKSEGYTIALDDFTCNYPYKEIIEFCDIIKVDFLQNTKEDIEYIIKKWNNDHRIFVAEKVETNEMFDFAKELGYDYFQGYFFSKPIIVKGKRLQKNKIQYLQIMDELNNKYPSYDKIAKIIGYNTNLAYELLRLVNSKFTLLCEVSSIKHALAFMGLKEIQIWVTLILMHGIHHEKVDEIIKTPLFRSNFGKLLAENSSYQKRKDEIMLMGLISIMDVLLEEPLEQILNKLPISKDIKNTLIGESTPLSDLYHLILHYEKGSWEEVALYAKKINIDMKKLPNFYFEAINWADHLFEYMNI